MMKKFCLTLLLLSCGCSTRQPGAASLVAPAAPASAPAPDSLIPAGAATTVEEDSEESTLNCAPLQGFPVHDETLKAFQNLSGATTGQRKAVLVGYGGPGLLCTGSSCNTVLTAMNELNVADWKDAAHLIQGKFSRLLVLGCNVGQSPEGLDFVTELARESKTRVRAPVGLVWCRDDSLFVEPGTQWVEARPGQRARMRASAGAPQALPVVRTYRLSIDGEMKDVPAKSIRIVQFQYLGTPPYGSGDIQRDEATSLVNLLGLGRPFRQKARPLAAATGRIQLSVTRNGEHAVVKRFTLYADAVLMDADAKDVFYRVDPGLHQRLQILRRHNLKPAHD